MTPDLSAEGESIAEAHRISELAEKDPKNEESKSIYITVRSHVFKIPKDIAINASKLFARAWNANSHARSITFKIQDKDSEDTDIDPEHFYAIDAIAHLVGYMYGNELGCPTSDIERHTGCLVAWCKVYKYAVYFEMEAACESTLARIEKCLGERKYCPGIPTREEVGEIYGMTREGSGVREALVDAMAKMGRLWDVVGEDHIGDTKSYVENWRRSSSVLREFQEAVWMRIGEGEEERMERIREARNG
ncbi:hypothetical protein BELL_0130g00030 [Botrytis elliptica]|uniref:BTB domain-containing protein n=1 Tax=Botrytis elliptica TaxID=278938 RepID=A0A4Z1K6H3_9HELO|nr:hypothetical protein EAE99_009714 [Botrytis elliptica]TGO76933.1 hypothetical protein BELL_0130g00030 [Botrytis elliptica]